MLPCHLHWRSGSRLGKNSVPIDLESTSQEVAVGIISDLFAAVLGGSFILNHGKPDEAFNNFTTCLLTVVVLLLWGLYRIVSCACDAIWARFSRR